MPRVFGEFKTLSLFHHIKIIHICGLYSGCWFTTVKWYYCTRGVAGMGGGVGVVVVQNSGGNN